MSPPRPKKTGTPPRSDAEFFSPVGIWQGARALLDVTPSWEAVAERLRPYALAEVLSAVGRIGAVLRNENSKGLELQLALAIGLFGRDKAEGIARRLEAIRALERASDPDTPTSNFILFGHRSIATLIQVAVHVCSPAEEDPKGPQSLQLLGEALLIVNDLVSVTPLNAEGQSYSTPEGRRKWVYYFSALAGETGNQPTVHQAARAADLFLNDKPHLHDSPDYVDLPALFAEATGLGVDAFALGLVYFLGTLYGINKENVVTRNVTFRIDSLMGSTLRFTRDQVERLFDLGGKDVNTFVAAIQKACPRGSVRPFYHLTLEQSPLVRFADFAICASLPFLERRLTTGLYHTLLNARPGDSNRAFRDRLMRYIGHVFADHTVRALHRISEKQAPRVGRKVRRGFPRTRLYTEAELQSALQGKMQSPLCDLLLVMGNVVLLVECKARMFSLAARAGDSEEEFFTRLDQIIIDGARQLEGTLSLLANGAFANLGLEPWRITDAYPIVVSLQEIFMNPILKRWLNDRLKESGYLQRARLEGFKVHDLEVFDVGDLEWLELAVETGGGKVAQILRSKQSDEFGREHSLASWAAIRQPVMILGGARLQYHAEVWRGLGDDALQYFRAHNVESPASDN